MKYNLNNKILEAINRGIKFALADLEDNEELSSISKLKIGLIEDKSYTRDLLNFKKDIIDLGLPSGTRWFKYNFGVNYKKLDKTPEDSIPEDWFGNYYAWGELEPKHTYARGNYKFYVENNLNRLITKYCSISWCGLNSITDNIMLLQPEDDVVYQNFVPLFGIKFNIPTKNQFEELVKNTIKEKQTDFNGVNGLNGLLFTSKINGNSIFFPNTGNYDGSSHEDKNLVTLWTANITEGNSHYATYFYGNNSTSFSSDTRFCGYPVRPVVILKN